MNLVGRKTNDYDYVTLFVFCRPAFLPIQMGLEKLVSLTEEEMCDQPSNFFSLLPAGSPAALPSQITSLQHLLNTLGDNRPISR